MRKVVQEGRQRYGGHGPSDRKHDNKSPVSDRAAIEAVLLVRVAVGRGPVPGLDGPRQITAPVAASPIASRSGIHFPLARILCALRQLMLAMTA